MPADTDTDAEVSVPTLNTDSLRYGYVEGLIQSSQQVHWGLDSPVVIVIGQRTMVDACVFTLRLAGTTQVVEARTWVVDPPLEPRPAATPDSAFLELQMIEHVDFGDAFEIPQISPDEIIQALNTGRPAETMPNFRLREPLGNVVWFWSKQARVGFKWDMVADSWVQNRTAAMPG